MTVKVKVTRLNIQDYAQQIALYEPFKPDLSSPKSKAQLVSELLNQLSEVLVSLGITHFQDHDAQSQRILLDNAMTVLPANYLSAESTDALTQLLQIESAERERTDVTDIAAKPFVIIGDTKIILWKGDITTLAVDAIVNAANNQMLGCFQPQHKCIDNAIHNRAGAQLRADCEVIMELQGNIEETGIAKITRAYNLPSKFVIHTVGPIVQNMIQPIHAGQLASSYRSILTLAKQTERIRSLAFCSISTGIFGYPIEQATRVALDTVTQWLMENPDQFDTIVFNVFSEYDHHVYQSALEDYVCQL
ncbi:protein-ADP-ribose hydrolase [Shewanella pealeana]|uniref:Appr-1-p processing domain protein n=1 Tax=Shewanella pealeana (strain ATCC 700345 / ANG-SQ1) TaxID=398579 RepID=A8H4N3_SHEPA|nr:protein-ADP-ribose hydrolase [Shewanella pealeana]ABV87520.1 Appr-1-p processing domain protein [Shewanella pealeana ATCC 700345]